MKKFAPGLVPSAAPVSEIAYRAPDAADREPEPSRTPESRSSRPSSFVARHVWWIVGVVLVAAAAGLVRWAYTRPGYDPYGWLVWGYQTLHGTLNLGGAPSWKPMPWLFTVPYALFGHFDLWLWMTTVVALSLAGVVFAGRIAFRIVDQGGKHRWPAIAAAVFAVVAILVIQDNQGYSYWHYFLSAQSDPPLASLCLAAIDLAMIRRYGWSYAALTLAALGRPESWPFMLLFLIWAWREREHRNMTPWIIAAGVVVLFLWFGIPTITNDRPLLSAQLAQHSPRMPKGSAVLGTIGRFKYLNLWPVWALAGIGVAWAAFRRNRAVLALFGAVLLWMAVEVMFSVQGFPGQPRYMFEPAVVAIVIAAVALGWLLAEIPGVLKVPRWGGIVVAVGLIAAFVPGAWARARSEHHELLNERARTREISRLAGLIHVLGGRNQILTCARPVLSVEWVSMFAWMMHMNTGAVGYKEQFELHKPTPSLIFTPLPNGWATYLWRPRASDGAACAKQMRILYVFTKHHPNGVVSPNTVPPTLLPLHVKAKG